MPNKRAPGQKLVNFPASEGFIASLDNAMGATGYSNRAEFIRDAIREKLEREGIQLPAGLELAPRRTGKLPPGREFSDDQIAAMAKTAVGVMVKGKRRRDERARRTRIKQRREPLGTETPHPDHLAGGQ